MDPVEQFEAERRTRIESYTTDADFNERSSAWRSQSMGNGYVYNFNWLGRPIIQYPQDIVAIQEIVWKTKPDLIIETGIARGGSLILSASLLAMLDLGDAIEAGATIDPSQSRRRVVGLDIDIRSHNRSAIETHPMASRIEMIEGSSVAEGVVRSVHEIAAGYDRVMVCMDSMHTESHVLAELDAYASLVTSGCYCIVFDTFVEDLEPGFFENRPWDVGNNPKTAVHKWLSTNKDFEIDRDIATKLQITVAPDGFLRKK